MARAMVRLNRYGERLERQCDLHHRPFFNKQLGWMCDRLRAEEYIADLESAGFVVESVSSLTNVARTHFNKMAAMHEARYGGVNDPWLQNNRRMLTAGSQFGVKVSAHKVLPAALGGQQRQVQAV